MAHRARKTHTDSVSPYPRLEHHRPPAADFLLNHQAEWPEAYTAQATKDDACMRAWCANGPSALTSIHHPQNTTDRPQRLSHVNHVAPSAENPAGLDLRFTLSY
jgi:hypothetical protein